MDIIFTFFCITDCIKQFVFRLQEEHIIFLKNLLAEDCTVTLKNIVQKFEENGLIVSQTTVHNAIAGFSYSFKRLTVQVVAGVTEALKAERRVFSVWLLDQVIQGRNLIFLDEVGFKLSQRVSYGRSEKGDPARLISPGIRTRNITVMAAMTRNG
jgi:hypothetical protein